MGNLPDKLTRQVVLEFISEAATYGNLGAFIGAGFSKAVLNDASNNVALSWGELLERVAERMGVDYSTIRKEGVGYPEIASTICKSHAKSAGIDYKTSVSELKNGIAALTSWYPDREKRALYSKYLESFSFAWIVTTNYDMIIEAILTGKAVPLSPNDSLTAPNGIIPVFHLHGLRSHPGSIIITQEDYVALFRPTEYRQIKLAITMKESTTIFIGYGVGDVNVQTALDWSNNVYESKQLSYPHDVVQILYKRSPEVDPYRDATGLVILEVADIASFFEEFRLVREPAVIKEKSERFSLSELAKGLEKPDKDLIDSFIDDANTRKDVLGVLAETESQIHLIAGFVSFLDRCIEEAWKRSEPSGAFEAYNQHVTLILDILTHLKFSQIPPALFQTVAYSLDRVGSFLGIGPGNSYSARDTWERRKTELSLELVHELKNAAVQHDYVVVGRLMKSLRPLS